MKHLLINFISVLIINVALANQVKVVECSAIVKEKKETVSLKVDELGNIVFWSQNQIAEANPKSIFGALSENFEFFGYEYLRTLVAPNGFSIIEGATTADAFKLGVSKNLTRGFYSYFDLGSGNGDKHLVLSCY